MQYHIMEMMLFSCQACISYLMEQIQEIDGIDNKSNMTEMQSQGSSLRVKCMQGSCPLL